MKPPHHYKDESELINDYQKVSLGRVLELGDGIESFQIVYPEHGYAVKLGWRLSSCGIYRLQGKPFLKLEAKYYGEKLANKVREKKDVLGEDFCKTLCNEICTLRFWPFVYAGVLYNSMTWGDAGLDAEEIARSVGLYVTSTTVYNVMLSLTPQPSSSLLRLDACGAAFITTKVGDWISEDGLGHNSREEVRLERALQRIYKIFGDA